MTSRPEAITANTAPTDVHVSAGGWLRLGPRRLRCALGWGGLRADKREGDGATPIGAWPLRLVLYRGDRLVPPRTALPCRRIRPWDGWCDAPQDPHYNRRVHLPHRASAEALWRADRLYDVVVVLGHNDDPVVPGAGSAVFLHVARRDYAPTAGCVALVLPDLLGLLRSVAPSSRLVVG